MLLGGVGWGKDQYGDFYVDEAHCNNLFLVLGKYVERQDENLLTQALVLLFNRVLPFRKGLCNLLLERFSSGQISSESLFARSQVGRRAHGRRVLVDMEIYEGGSPSPLFLIESKLDAGLGPAQLKNYRSALKKLPPATRLVILTRHGADESLWKYTPRNTIWLSWPMVAEMAASAAQRASRIDQLLLKDFLAMAKLKGIPTVPRMTTDGLQRLGQFSHFSFNKSSRTSHKTIAAVDVAMQRLQEHRDGVWESFFARSTVWRPYQSIYRFDGKYAVLQVGFWRSRPRRNVQQSYLGLELVCKEKPLLYVTWGWQLGRKHPRYQRGDSYEYDEHAYSAGATRKVFRKPMPVANRILEKDLRRFARKFLRSRYAG